MITLLPVERWHEIEEILADKFDSISPDPSNAKIVADFDSEGNIKGFLIVEMFLRVGQIHSDGGSPGAMLRYVDESIPTGTTIVAIATDERFERLCSQYGMREVEGKIFRLDK